ncbi:MAG: hypothetical protein GXY38_04540 [Planctomycetes bacterium]|nr:hypothetical protein [Planctomycetota bacterium]
MSTHCLRAGVARADITTDDKRAAVNDPLYAKALVLDDGAVQTVIISMDTTAIGGRRVSAGMLNDVGEDFLPDLRYRIERKLGISGFNVLVNASHTHPPGPLLCNDYQQVERVFNAVKQAQKTMEPVTIGWGKGREDRISINRTLRLKDGRAWTMRHGYPCPPDEDVAGLGPIDPEIGIIRIDRLDGRPLAVVYNFACHPLIGMPGAGITANYPGFASKVIEDNLDGAMAIFLQGAAGDVNELHYKNVNIPRSSEPGGTLLGLSTLGALKSIKTGTHPLSVAFTTIDLPRRTDIPQRIDALAKRQNELLRSLRGMSLNFKAFLPLYIKYGLNPEFPSDYSYIYMHAHQIASNELADMDAVNRANINRYLANIRSMEELSKIQDDIETLLKHQQINAQAGQSTIPAELMAIKLGECVILSAPIELLAQIGLNIKAASGYEHTLVAGYSNGYMHYGAPVADYDAGGYEVTECLLASDWQSMFEKAAISLIRQL